MSDYLDSDPTYVQAFLDHCDLVMPMNELKADMLRPDAASFDFGRADRIVDLALSNGLATRGHALLWYGATPPWMEATHGSGGARTRARRPYRDGDGPLSRARAELGRRQRGHRLRADKGRSLARYELAAHDGPASYPGRVPDGAARRIPRPASFSTISTWSSEGPRFDLRRAIALSIVRQLQDAGIGIDGIGIQGHLYAEQTIDIEALASFGEALKRLGVRLLVTELDVIDWKIEGGPAEQDAAASKVVGDLLDGVFAAGPPEAVVAWGITDRYSWIPGSMPRPDGKPSRPLPLDTDLRRKSWYGLIRNRLERGA